MATHTTRWSPDTCDCVIEYQWDTAQPESTRTHTLSNYVNVCSAHQGLANNTARYNAVLDENPRKNITRQLILDNAPTSLFDVISGGGRDFKSNVIFSFSWSGTAPDRVLTITITGITLTTQQKNTIQTALNTRFGSGKVLIA